MTRAGPFVLEAGESRADVKFASGRLAALAGVADTDGALSVLEGEIGQGGPPLHVHDEIDEMLYVLDGNLEVQVGDMARTVGPGMFVWMPRGVPHAYANHSGGSVRLLGIAMPGGLEHFLNEQAAYLESIQGGAPDPEQMAAIAAKHGSRVVGPPIAGSPLRS